MYSVYSPRPRHFWCIWTPNPPLIQRAFCTLNIRWSEAYPLSPCSWVFLIPTVFFRSKGKEDISLTIVDCVNRRSSKGSSILVEVEEDIIMTIVDCVNRTSSKPQRVHFHPPSVLISQNILVSISVFLQHRAHCLWDNVFAWAQVIVFVRKLLPYFRISRLMPPR